MADPKDKKNLTLSEKYKLKGAQQMTYTDYAALKAKVNPKKVKFKIPTFVKFILGTPFVIIFIFGILFIPYMIYLILTSPSAPLPKDDVQNVNDTTR